MKLTPTWTQFEAWVKQSEFNHNRQSEKRLPEVDGAHRILRVRSRRDGGVSFTIVSFVLNLTIDEIRVLISLQEAFGYWYLSMTHEVLKLVDTDD